MKNLDYSQLTINLTLVLSKIFTQYPGKRQPIK